MKANELRIGNLVYFEFQNKSVVHKVVPKDIHVMNLCEMEFAKEADCFKPIQLTENELLKLGFTCDENKMYRNDRICVNWGNWGTVTILGTDGGYAIPFQHENQTVHWMQNLYFALTGKELTYKP